jgi:hypothetical protein
LNAQEFLRRTTNSQGDFVHEFITLLETRQVSFCLIGGLAVNAYAEPVVSLDMDLVVVADQLEALVEALETCFAVRRFSHSVNVSSPGSDLRIQIQTDARYQPFVHRATPRKVLGYEAPVAALEDVLQGKLWAYQDAERRPSKRQKDLADILRLAEAHPHLANLLPENIKSMLK